MNADEIVKALRLCGETTDCVVERIGCPYYENTDDCKDELLFDAADLIEAQLELQELAKAKADGRLVVLPCKVGDVVYEIIDSVDMPYVRQEKVIAIELWNKNGAMTMFIRTPYGLFEFDKTVFLAREAAEKAIAEVGE